MTPKWLNDDEQDAWRAWLDMYLLLLPAFDRHLHRDSGASDYEVLAHLFEAPGRRLRMGEVAERAVSTRSAVTRTVDRLEGRGWVRRERSVDDQRGRYAELTEPGALALAEMAPRHVAAMRECLIELLSESELRAFRAIGERVRLQMTGRDGPGR